MLGLTAHHTSAATTGGRPIDHRPSTIGLVCSPVAQIIVVAAAAAGELPTSTTCVLWLVRPCPCRSHSLHLLAAVETLDFPGWDSVRSQQSVNFRPHLSFPRAAHRSQLLGWSHSICLLSPAAHLPPLALGLIASNHLLIASRSGRRASAQFERDLPGICCLQLAQAPGSGQRGRLLLLTTRVSDLTGSTVALHYSVEFPLQRAQLACPSARRYKP